MLKYKHRIKEEKKSQKIILIIRELFGQIIDIDIIQWKNGQKRKTLGIFNFFNIYTLNLRPLHLKLSHVRLEK